MDKTEYTGQAEVNEVDLDSGDISSAPNGLVHLGLGPAVWPTGVPLRTPVHPGRFLQKNVFKPMRLSQTEVAQRLGVSRRRVNEIIQGRRALSPDSALRCAINFNVSASYLLGMQGNWESFQAWQALKGKGQVA